MLGIGYPYSTAINPNTDGPSWWEQLFGIIRGGSDTYRYAVGGPQIRGVLEIGNLLLVGVVVVIVIVMTGIFSRRRR